MFSILVSAAAVSFSSVSISIEYDVEPKKREFNGSFYGFYPKNNRLLVFLFMLGFTMAHVLMKVLACALVLDLSGDWVAFYMAGDVSLYLLYKIIRHDFIYWVPMESLPLSLAVSTIVRIMIKVVADFTLIVQFRHDFELGGAYWSLNAVIQQLGCFVAVYLYSRDVDEGDEKVKFLWSTVTCLFLLFGLNFVGFLSTINKGYAETFYTTRTGKQFAMNCYLNSENSDELRFDIFSHHRSYYDTIQQELMKWLNDHWQEWEDGHNAHTNLWFAADAIETVPPDMLPIKVLVDLGGISGRRASLDGRAAKEKADKEAKAAREESLILHGDV